MKDVWNDLGLRAYGDGTLASKEIAEVLKEDGLIETSEESNTISITERRIERVRQIKHWEDIHCDRISRRF